MQYLWTGKWQEHRAPIISELTIDGLTFGDSVHLKNNENYKAEVTIDKKTNNALRYSWEIMREVDKYVESDGGDFEPTPEVVWHQSETETSHQIEFKAPSAGEYRLYVYIEDAYGSAATANLPILVEPLVASKRG